MVTFRTILAQTLPAHHHLVSVANTIIVFAASRLVRLCYWDISLDAVWANFVSRRVSPVFESFWSHFWSTIVQSLPALHHAASANTTDVLTASRHMRLCYWALSLDAVLAILVARRAVDFCREFLLKLAHPIMASAQTAFDFSESQFVWCGVDCGSIRVACSFEIIFQGLFLIIYFYLPNIFTSCNYYICLPVLFFFQSFGFFFTLDSGKPRTPGAFPCFSSWVFVSRSSSLSCRTGIPVCESLGIRASLQATSICHPSLLWCLHCPVRQRVRYLQRSAPAFVGCIHTLSDH